MVKKSKTSHENSDTIESSNDFTVVGIGASAGGLDALSQLFSALRSDLGLAYIVVQHLDPKHPSGLAEILSRTTSMKVFEIETGMRIVPDCVYILPPNVNLSVESCKLILSPREKTIGLHLTIDAFFISLASQYKDQTVGIVLSGTGTDGSKGLAAIKAEYGITIAQYPQSARFDEMPKSAIQAGAADLILNPAEIAMELQKASQKYYDWVQSPAGQAADQEPDRQLMQIMKLLRESTNVDFSEYKRNTLMRRLARRMAILRLSDLTNYIDFLEKNPQELQELFKDILIHVTGFFRDPLAFEAFQRNLIPKLFAREAKQEPVRVWVPGCSTGEEAYSIAISILEYLDQEALHRPVQIFASDLSEVAIRTARSGQYKDVRGVAPELLRKYFDPIDGGYRVKKILREVCIFSRQNLAGDPPFSKLDLISCRNVFIYFSNDLQRKIFPIFHFSLNKGGYLWLGVSETVGEGSDLFELADKVGKFYLKRKVQQTPKIEPQPSTRGATKVQSLEAPAVAVLGKKDIQSEIDRIAISEYVPPSVVINEAMIVQQVRGHTAPYLELSQGSANLNLLKMLNPDLVPEVRAAIAQAGASNKSVKKENLVLTFRGQSTRFDLKVVPSPVLSRLKEKYFSIFFEQRRKTARQSTPNRKTKSPPAGRILKGEKLEVLQEQIEGLREYQRLLIEDYETHQEQLSTANEELQSNNEEMQSANEELETAKEELQSTNQEMTTVNDEMAARNIEMSRMNDDLSNFFESIEISLVMVDLEFHIRRYSPEAVKVLGLKTSDIGIPLDVVLKDQGFELLDSILKNVIKTGATQEIETQNHTQHWFRLQVRPYKTANSKIAGAVVAWIDIDKLKKGSLEFKEVGDDANALFESNLYPLVVVGHDQKIARANLAFYEQFHTDKTATEGWSLAELSGGDWNKSELLLKVSETIHSGRPFIGLELEWESKTHSSRTLVINGRKVMLSSAPGNGVLLSIEDVTKRRKNENDLKSSEEKYRNLVATSYNGIMVVRRDSTIEFANPRVEQMFGYQPGELTNIKCGSLLPDQFNVKHAKLYQAFMANPSQLVIDSALNPQGKRKDGTLFPIEVSLSPFTLNSEVFVNCLVSDITEQKKIEEEKKHLVVQERALRDEAIRNNKNKDEFLATLSHELRTPLTTILGWTQLLQTKELDPEVRKALTVVERSAQAQGQLIDDLLDVSRIHAGKIGLNVLVVDLVEVLKTAVASASLVAEKKGVKIELKLPEDNCPVLADTFRLQQVFWNLLSNALKFTPKGGEVVLSLKVVENSKGRMAVIQVKDNGMGIRPDFLSHIFERFSQVDSSMTRVYGGLGLGLAIVKSLIELHRGTVGAQSEGLGMGSIFSVSLPIVRKKIAEDSKDALSTNCEVRLDGVKILVVDDNVDNLYLFDVMLKSLGAEVYTADSADSCLRHLPELQPDLLLSDISMPGADGYTLIRRIRSLDPVTSINKIPAIALTAYAAPEDIKLATLAGFSGHIAKPVDRSGLALAIRNLLGPAK